MCTSLMRCVITVAILCVPVQLARILCVFPMPSFSHQIVFRAYTDELARQGHEIVIVTPDPHLPIVRPKDNVTEIDISFSYKMFRDLMEKLATPEFRVRGAAINTDKFDVKSFVAIIDMYRAQLNHPPLKKILDDRTQRFDLLVIECFIDYSLILTDIYKVPTIVFSSFYGTPENFDAVGAVSRHPVFYPHMLLSKFDSSNLWDKIKRIYWNWNMYDIYKKVEVIEDRILKSQFGSKAPTIGELRNNIDLLFLNSHPMFDHNRPVPPNVVSLCSLHLKPVKELPEDLKSYLDNSKHGVVYISLGTNVQPKLMDKDLLDAFLNAIEALPYDVIWKHHGDLESQPKNLKTLQWVPQRDMLTHPNLKLFVTQGGRQSLDEAIDAGIPMVCIPMFGDQWYNVKRAVELGICKGLDISTMTGDELLNAVTSVIKDESYRRNIQNVRSIINDQPEKSMERAIWWTEYLLRHGGAKHLRSPLANTSWSEYLMLDVVVAVAALSLLILATLICIIVYVVRLLSKFFVNKIKIS